MGICSHEVSNFLNLSRYCAHKTAISCEATLFKKERVIGYSFLFSSETSKYNSRSRTIPD